MPYGVACPYGCDGAVVVRLTDDVVEYTDTTPEGPVTFTVAIEVPVYWCEICDSGWTDWRSEDIRGEAIQAKRIQVEIDQQVLDSLKTSGNKVSEN